MIGALCSEDVIAEISYLEVVGQGADLLVSSGVSLSLSCRQLQSICNRVSVLKCFQKNPALCYEVLSIRTARLGQATNPFSS